MKTCPKAPFPKPRTTLKSVIDFGGFAGLSSFVCGSFNIRVGARLYKETVFFALSVRNSLI